MGDETFGYSGVQIRMARDVSLVELVRTPQYGIEVKRVGGRYKALCPFHNEKTPSFNIDEGKGFFKCFGCGWGGDSISFVRKIEGKTFPEAIDSISVKYNLGLVPKDQIGVKRSVETTQRAFAVLASAAEYYEKVFAREQRRGSGIADYLFGDGDGARKFPETAARDWHIGYADGSAAELVDFILSHVKDAKIEDIYNQGLLNKPKEQRHEKDFYPFFQHRLMFPVNDEHGRVVGFSGRTIPAEYSGLPEDHFIYSTGKYMNSRGSVVPLQATRNNKEIDTLFQKSRLLFGLDRAWRNISKADEAIVIEGHLNAITMHIAGLTNTVAALGTSFTKEGAQRISQLAKKVLVLNDSNAGGIASTKRTVNLIYQAGSVPHVALLPGSEDPDDVRQRCSSLEETARVLRSHLYPGTPLVDFFIDNAPDSKTPEGKNAIAKELLDTLWLDTDRLRAGIYLVDAAKKLKVPIQLLTRGLKDKLEPLSIPRDQFFTQTSQADGDVVNNFLASLLFYDAFEVGQILQKVPMDNPLMNENQRKLYHLITTDIFRAGGSELAAGLKKRALPSDAYVSRAVSRQALLRLSDIAVQSGEILPKEIIQPFMKKGRQNPAVALNLVLHEMKMHRRNAAITSLEEIAKSGDADATIKAMDAASKEFA